MNSALQYLLKQMSNQQAGGAQLLKANLNQNDVDDAGSFPIEPDALPGTETGGYTWEKPSAEIYGGGGLGGAGPAGNLGGGLNAYAGSLPASAWNVMDMSGGFGGGGSSAGPAAAGGGYPAPGTGGNSGSGFSIGDLLGGVFGSTPIGALVSLIGGKGNSWRPPIWNMAGKVADLFSPGESWAQNAAGNGPAESWAQNAAGNGPAAAPGGGGGSGPAGAAGNTGTGGPTGFDFRSGGFSSAMNPRGGGWSPAMSSFLGNLALNNYASGGGWGSGGHALTMRAL